MGGRCGQWVELVDGGGRDGWWVVAAGGELAPPHLRVGIVLCVQVGYVIHSPRTGEIIDFGGSEEVIALGHKCLTARRAKDVLARRSGEVALLLAGAETSLQGLNQRTSLAEQASEGGAIAITGVVQFVPM